ncbi:hypothetical protein JTB14_012818 [Gonioctena quinquepunctata]|nr:hypothetical protein JTB14_012818 [Gonioctena quinquepunctata]
MNSDMWKNTDTTEDDLKAIATVMNKTKEEVQNGVRSLMLQIGKVSNKENDIPLGTSGDYDKFEKKLDDNFEKILTNQDVFLESCHRLQMDESQIESEISVMLNKLIDMLEKKLGSEAKDIKNFEKALKNHDSRTNRNLLQANQNIISLFEKSTESTQIVTNEIKKVSNDLNALFAFVQSTLNEEPSPSTSINRRIILDKLSQIENFTRNLSHDIQTNSLNANIKENVTNNDIYREIQKLSKSLGYVTGAINNNTRATCLQRTDADRLFNTFTTKYLGVMHTKSNVTREKLNEGKRDQSIGEAVIRVFGPASKLPIIAKKNKCKTGEGLIDVRAGKNKSCEEITKKPRRKRKKYKIDIRADSSNASENIDELEYEDYETGAEGSNASMEETTYESIGTTFTDESSESIPPVTEKNDHTSTYYSET